MTVRIPSMILRILRVMPSQIILATVAVCIAHFFYKVPDDRLAIAALVPCLAIFLVNRLLILLPTPTEEQKKETEQRLESLPLIGRILVFAVVAEIILVPAALVAAGMYAMLGMTAGTSSALMWARNIGLLTPIVALLVFATIKTRAVVMEFNCGRLVPIAVMTVFEICYIPTRLANLLSAHGWHIN